MLEDAVNDPGAWAPTGVGLALVLELAEEDVAELEPAVAEVGGLMSSSNIV